MRSRAIATVVALLVASTATGCFHATYTNLYGHEGATQYQGEALEHAPSWHNFFVFGWIPSEVTIESGKICGERGVQEIRTEESFLQAAVAIVTSYYVTIYKPWTGETICR